MKVICPYCQTEVPTTIRRLKAAKPLLCPNCRGEIKIKEQEKGGKK